MNKNKGYWYIPLIIINLSCSSSSGKVEQTTDFENLVKFTNDLKRLDTNGFKDITFYIRSNNDKIFQLEMYGEGGAIAEMPGSLSKLTNLYSLTVRNIGLKKIPNLDSLKKLSFLDLYENQITGNILLDKKSLGEVNLGGNNIESISFDKNLNLKKLILYNNKINRIDDSWAYLNLKALDIRDNSIPNDEFDKIIKMNIERCNGCSPNGASMLE